MNAITIVIVEAANKDLRKLVSLLDAELLQRYPAEGIFGLDLDAPDVKHVLFSLAYEDDTPVACGGIRPLDAETAEIKRFYVSPSHRGKGVASNLLAFLEEQARAKGFGRLLLETGPKQPEAIGLYTKYGYRQIPLFGEYVGCEEYSICMEKTLHRTP